jgi:hypothetical protein
MRNWHHQGTAAATSADGAVAAAFVGSSNLSASGIAGGIE